MARRISVDLTGAGGGGGSNERARERARIGIAERLQRAGGVLPQQQQQLQARAHAPRQSVVDISTSSSSDDDVEKPRKVMNTCREVRQKFRAQQALDAQRRIPRRNGPRSIFGLTRDKPSSRSVLRPEKEKKLEPKQEQDLDHWVRPEEKMKAIKMKQEEDAAMRLVLPQRCILRSDGELWPEGIQPRQLDRAERRILVTTYHEFQKKMKELTNDISDIKLRLEESERSGRGRSLSTPVISLDERNELLSFLTELSREREKYVDMWRTRVSQLGTLPPPKEEESSVESVECKWVRCTVLGFTAYLCVVNTEARRFFGPPRLTRDDAIFDYQELHQAVMVEKVEEYLIKNQQLYDPDCLSVMLRNLGAGLDRRRMGKNADQRLKDAQDRRSGNTYSDSENSDSDAPLQRRRRGRPEGGSGKVAGTESAGVRSGGKANKVLKKKGKKVSQKALREKAKALAEFRKRKMERLKDQAKEVLAKSKGVKLSQPTKSGKRGGRGPGKKLVKRGAQDKKSSAAPPKTGQRRLIKRSGR